MRQVKCKKCGNKQDQDKAYLYVHMTSGGNKQNRYYCNEYCYNQEQKDVFMLKQCQYFIDETLGYVCVNNAKNNNIKELVSSGYTREEIYNCMTELSHQINESLNYRQDITDEYGKIQYIFAIIKGRIREITLKNKSAKKSDVVQVDIDKVKDFIDMPITQVKATRMENKKKTLMDIIKEKNNGK